MRKMRKNSIRTAELIRRKYYSSRFLSAAKAFEYHSLNNKYISRENFSGKFSYKIFICLHSKYKIERF